MLIISDIFWNEIKTIIPQKKSKVGRPPKDAKLILKRKRKIHPKSKWQVKQVFGIQQ